ncbi:CsbD family protein [Variovorax sp. Root434]|uniref:CsbD family protein n=1 Tax=Variovorax sp. Root434 TaxID=1736536 RepID=UPI000700C94E|nr:CsbD family protein [Variovorax sp. Root434]KQX30168.1 general stress protein CsbD [Variovorax sp. Root434]
MNKDQLAGRVEEAKGKLKEAAGKAIGNEKLEGKGIAEQAAGKVQKTYGDVKERAKDAIKSGADKL